MTQEQSAEGIKALPLPINIFFNFDTLKDRPVRVEIKASPAQCEALAKLNGLVAIADFIARFDVVRLGRTGAKVTGEVRAHITQNCVVSLEPFDSEMREPVEVRFAEGAKDFSGAARPKRGEFLKEAQELVVEHHIGEEEEPDPIVDGKINLGALACEFFALALDPYPRAPGVDLAELAKNVPNLEVNAPLVEEAELSPFAALAQLKTKSKTGD